MDRLTFDGNFCDISVCQEVPCKYPETGCSQKQVWERLKAYEDTGVQPEEIESIITASVGAPEWAHPVTIFGLPLGEVRKLVFAKEHGRLLMLPCKLGDTLWMVVERRPRIDLPYRAFIKQSTLTFFNMQRCIEEFGKTVFLTRDEAHKAMEAKWNENR